MRCQHTRLGVVFRWSSLSPWAGTPRRGQDCWNWLSVPPPLGLSRIPSAWSPSPCSRRTDPSLHTHTRHTQSHFIRRHCYRTHGECVNVLIYPAQPSPLQICLHLPQNCKEKTISLIWNDDILKCLFILLTFVLYLISATETNGFRRDTTTALASGHAHKPRPQNLFIIKYIDFSTLKNISYIVIHTIIM